MGDDFSDDGGGQRLGDFGEPLAAPRRHRYENMHVTPKGYESGASGEKLYFDQQRVVLEELEREMLLYRDAHGQAKGHYGLRYHVLLVLCFLMAGCTGMVGNWLGVATCENQDAYIAGAEQYIAGAVAFTADSVAAANATYVAGAAEVPALVNDAEDACRAYRICVTCVAAGNALCVAVLALMKHQSKMDAHANAATQFGELYQSFHFGKFATQFTFMELDELMKKLDGTKRSFTDVGRSCPYPLPAGIRARLTASLDEVEERRHQIFNKMSTARSTVGKR